MRREKKEADRKRKTELMEAFGKYLAATPWLGPETHWRNAEDKIRQEFSEYGVLVEIGADCRTVFEKACEDKRREVQYLASPPHYTISNVMFWTGPRARNER
jgi:hypothetical protein